MNSLTKTVILASCLCYFVSLADTTCLFGTHESLPGESCRQILHVQPECFGLSGFYWVKTGSDIDYVYCDMYHKGGGWRRVVYWHSGTNTSCPGSFDYAYWYHDWCYRDYWDQRFSSYEWNSNQKVTFSEIRGYFNIRILYNKLTDGFHDFRHYLPEHGHIDGVDVVLGQSPLTITRTVFAYVVGVTTTGSKDRCPVNGGVEYGRQRRNYRDYEYACDELWPSGPHNYPTRPHLDQEFFPNTTCTMCPAGSPWFEQRYADAVQDKRVQIRFVNSDRYWADNILVKDFELYVR